MLETIFIGLSGMQSFQRGLSNISNNIANLNSPGYKRSEMRFSDLMYQYQPSGDDWLAQGSGVRLASTSTNFKQGELSATGNPLDIAINGEGFFVSRQGERTFYSRVGQFDIAPSGLLVSKTDGSTLQGLDAQGKLTDFSIQSVRSQAAKPTTTITFADNLSSGSQTHSLNFTAYDQDGIQRNLKATFSNNAQVTPGSWQVEIEDSASSITIGSGEIRFSSGGTLLPGFNDFAITLTAKSGVSSRLTLDFGVPGSLSAVTSLSGGSSSTLRVSEQDGYAAGSLTSLSFGQDGVATIKYSNGQSATTGQLALAWFTEPQTQLRRIGSAAYEALNNQHAQIGKPANGIYGTIAGSTLELSNVDLSSEFSEMIITQRGYQAASQLITAANEMMQQALQMRGK
ncbi:flagellar hook-basal body complex protein [Neisseriaceae bacterium TC5R-5]|nr:flagellar hook-basal body complex protein [Neisseriaceae bacterium TC5R-5]